MMTESFFLIQDPDDLQQKALLDQFADLCKECFPDPNELEDRNDWANRLRTSLPSPMPLTHILVAVQDLSGSGEHRMQGGVVFEYYQESRCGLIAYLAVRPEYRRKGLARAMIEKAGAIFQREAERAGDMLEAVFAESNDPNQVVPGHDSMPPAERLLVMGRLGAKWLDLPYVMPALGECQCRGQVFAWRIVREEYICWYDFFSLESVCN